MGSRYLEIACLCFVKGSRYLELPCLWYFFVGISGLGLVFESLFAVTSTY